MSKLEYYNIILFGTSNKLDDMDVSTYVLTVRDHDKAVSTDLPMVTILPKIFCFTDNIWLGQMFQQLMLRINYLRGRARRKYIQ